MNNSKKIFECLIVQLNQEKVPIRKDPEITFYTYVGCQQREIKEMYFFNDGRIFFTTFLLKTGEIKVFIKFFRNNAQEKIYEKFSEMFNLVKHRGTQEGFLDLLHTDNEQTTKNNKIDLCKLAKKIMQMKIAWNLINYWLDPVLKEEYTGLIDHFPISNMLKTINSSL